MPVLFRLQRNAVLKRYNAGPGCLISGWDLWLRSAGQRMDSAGARQSRLGQLAEPLLMLGQP